MSEFTLPLGHEGDIGFSLSTSREYIEEEQSSLQGCPGIELSINTSGRLSLCRGKLLARVGTGGPAAVVFPDGGAD